MYNPVSRSYGEPHKRPEVQNATIEFIAPSEYMVGFPSSNDNMFILLMYLYLYVNVIFDLFVIKRFVFSLVSTAEASTTCCLPLHS